MPRSHKPLSCCRNAYSSAIRHMSFAQYERELTMERTAVRMKARAQKGKWNEGWMPLGYDYITEEQLLVPNPQESRIIQTVFDIVIQRRRLKDVRDALNAMGCRTKTRVVTTSTGEEKNIGGNRFSYDAIKLIVQNPIYKGFIRYQDKLYPAVHEPLISQEVWEDANAALSRYKPRRRPVRLRPRDDHVHLLKGLVKCSECGSTMMLYPSGKKGRGGLIYTTRTSW